MDFQRFDSWIDEHRDAYLEQLIALCKIPSTATRPKALKDAAEYVLDLARESGLDAHAVRVGDGADFIVADGGQGARNLLIYNHYDVQPEDPVDLWHSPPFVPTIIDGKLVSRGVADNKSNLVARLCAIHAWKQTIGDLPLNVRCVFEGEEETGSLHLGQFAIENQHLLTDMDGCLWEMGYRDEDGRPTILLGVKGIQSVELRVTTASRDVHSGMGGIVPNAAWRLVEALHTLRAPDGTVLVDGVQDMVRLPSAEDIKVLEALPMNEEKMHADFKIKAFVGGRTGVALRREYFFRPTCTINGLTSGYQGDGGKTIVPAKAIAKLDFRLVPDLTPAIMLELLRKHLDRRGFGDIEIVQDEPGTMPARTDPATLVARASQAALNAVNTQPSLIYPTAGGSGPMYELCQSNGIPATCFGVGHAHSFIHAPNENIILEDFFIGIKVLGRFLHYMATMEA